MTSTAIGLIASTFEAASRDTDRFTAAFHHRAGTLDPALAAALPRHGRSKAIDLLDAVASFASEATAAGRGDGSSRTVALRPRWAGIQPRHYGRVGQALLDALRACLGPEFSDRARAAWADAFVLFAEDLMARSYNRLDLVA